MTHRPRTTHALRAFATGTVAALIVCGATLLAPSPASAHSELLETTPADGATLTEAPTEVQLVFGEPVQADGSAIVVQGDDGARYDQPDTFAVKDTVATVQLAPGAGAGTYDVTFRIVSEDGHVVDESFSYSVTGSGSGSGTSATPQSSAPTVSASPVNAADTSEGDSSSFLWVLGLGAIGLVLVAAIIAVVVRGRRERSD